MTIAKLTRCKLSGNDKIPVDLTSAGDKILRSEIYKLFNSISNKEKFYGQWKEPVIVPNYKTDDKADCSKH
jgi:hypothetical protein